MAVFSLGVFTFFSCGSPGDHATGPNALQRSGVLLTRPGVPGSCVVNHGIQTGNPFELETMVDVASVAVAKVRHGQYRDAVFNSHMQLIWQNFDYDTINQRFVVTNVGQPNIKTPTHSCGGLNGLPVWLTTRWSLIASPIT